MGFDEPQLLVRRPQDFGEHVGCARIAPSGARIHVGAHRRTELGQRHGTEVVAWVGEVWTGPRPTPQTPHKCVFPP